MKMNWNRKIVLLALIMINCICIVFAKDTGKGESPYFVVLTGEGEIARLPLKSTKVDVNVSGVIADVNVKQTYTNTGKSTIEAIYVFPASTRAAVYDMEMRIGDRKIRAKIEEKKKARKMYDKAKKKGKTASLLEEERANVFKMSVANIMPGATVEVDMSYTELLVPTDKVYEFVYPTVVGPRYVSKEEYRSGNKSNWNGNPYLKEGVEPTSRLDLKVILNTGIAIQSILCETHENKVGYTGKSSASITMTDPKGGDRDFILQYKLAGEQIETGVLVYDNAEGEKFFLAMLQPPARVKPENIPAREYIFIVDVSGSMNGFPLDISKELMRNLLGGLRPSDLFNIVFFAGGSQTYAKESLPVTQENIEKAIHFMDNSSGYGGTELLNALQTAMGMNQKDDFARSFVILTDGFVNVEKQTYDYIRQNLGNANFFSFGIGSAVNRYIIEGMAHVGYGEPFVAINEKEAKSVAEKFQKYISQPVLTNVTYRFEGFNAYDVMPEVVPDLFAERPIVISGKYRGSANGKLIVQGESGGKAISQSIEIKNDKSENRALRYLWAREKIRLLGDYNNLGKDGWSTNVNRDSLKRIITDLGLKYNLLTEYTSFIAVDTIVSNKGGKQNSVKQPIPLPQGVSNSAIGGMTRPGVKGAALEDCLEIEDSDAVEEYEVEIKEVYEEEEEEDEDLPFVLVEDMPSFPGGIAALTKYLNENVKYPEEARKNGIQGRVFVNFVIDTDGSVVDVKIVRGVHALLDAEALRVVKAMPKWKAGKQRGKPVRVSYTLPIEFRLGS
ncbi:TonB family protein [Marinifilum flexuosum]|uniref:TonB family protein n=1 Tax=Marinifilum flexuosum TaxID=1117708 RepID=UPI0024932B39|nr:TonB family protein [Marinifilum flexuosum]